MKLNYDRYVVFYYAAKYKSFSLAAKILNNSQPNITRTINLLEEDLGCNLFVRSNKGVRLTPEGETLFYHVNIAYNVLHGAEEKLTIQKDLSAGSIDIAISEIALYEKMLSIIDEFHTLYPNIHLRISNCRTPEALELLKNGEVEMAVTTTPSFIDSYLEMIEIKVVEDILLASNRYSELKDKEVSLQDLKDYSFIANSLSTKSNELYKQLFLENDLSFDPIIETSSIVQAVTCIAKGIGIGFVPSSFLNLANIKEHIFKVQLKETINERTICLAYDKERPMSVAAKRMLEFIIERKSTS